MARTRSGRVTGTVMPAALRRLTRSRSYPPVASHTACVAPARAFVPQPAVRASAAGCGEAVHKTFPNGCVQHGPGHIDTRCYHVPTCVLASVRSDSDRERGALPVLRCGAEVVSVAPGCERRAPLTSLHRLGKLWVQYNIQVTVAPRDRPWPWSRGKAQTGRSAGTTATCSRSCQIRCDCLG